MWERILIFALSILILSCSKTQYIKVQSPCHHAEITDNLLYSKVSNLLLNTTGLDLMYPTISKDSSLLLDYVYNDTKICIGDIIAYTPSQVYCDKEKRIHPVFKRIITAGKNGLNDYYIVKGDNEISPENCEIYKQQINYIVVGIIY